MAQEFKNERMAKVFNMVTMSKENFASDYEKHGDSDLVEELVFRIEDLEKGVKRLQENLNAEQIVTQRQSDQIALTAFKLIEASEMYGDETLYEEAKKLITHAECLRYKLNNNKELFDDDRQFIYQMLDKLDY